MAAGWLVLRSGAVRIASSPLARRAVLALLLALLLGSASAPPALAAKVPKAGDVVIAGRVVDEHGEAVAGATLVATSAADPALRVEAIADRKGEFELLVPVSGGEYTVRAEAEGYTPFEGAVPVVAGERVEIAFTLITAATIGLQEAAAAYNQGVEALAAGDAAAAERAFRRALELSPGMAEPQRGLAGLYRDQGRLEEAAAAIDGYLAARGEEAGDPPAAVLLLAYAIHRDLGHAERAEELLDALAGSEEGRRLAPEIHNQGVAAVQTGDEDKALERFARARLLDPELAPAHTVAATILYNRERYDEAAALLDRLAGFAPHDPQGLKVRYLIHDARGEDAAAAAAIEAYAAVDAAGAAGVLTQRGELDFKAGDTARAIAALERALELASDSARTHYALGLVYAGSDPERAKGHLRRFLELAPEDPEAGTARELLRGL